MNPFYLSLSETEVSAPVGIGLRRDLGDQRASFIQTGDSPDDHLDPGLAAEADVEALIEVTENAVRGLTSLLADQTDQHTRHPAIVLPRSCLGASCGGWRPRAAAFPVTRTADVAPSPFTR